MSESSLLTEFEYFEIDLGKKLEENEIDIVQAFEQYKSKRDEIEEERQSKLETAQYRRKVPSPRHFLGESFQRVQMVSIGYKFFNKLKLLGTAVLQSVPNAIRKRYSAVDLKIDNLTENLCKKLVVKVNGVVYAVRDYESLRILNPKFETFMLEWFQPKKGEVFVDIGSHVGKYSIATSKIVGDEGRVVAIEAHPSNFVLLNQNMKFNNLKNMVAFNLAAWDKQCKLQFLVGSTSANSNVNRYCYGHGSIEVQAQKMDRLIVNDLSLKRVDWIKIDVEGAEYEVLLGLEETLSRFKPKLIIEVWSKNIENVKALLNRHGYVFVKFSEFGEAQSQCFVDVLCVPASS